MKILYMTSSMGVGGIEMNLVRLTVELRARGHEVVVVSAPGTLVGELIRAGGRHVPMTLSHRRPITSARSVMDLHHAMRAVDPDVVHVFSASSAAVLWPALRIGRGRRPSVVSTIMGLKMSADEPSWVTLVRAWAVSLGSDRLIITAPAIADVVRRLPIRRRRLVEAQVVGVPAPVEGGSVTNLRDELGLSRATPLVVTIGRLAADKSHHLFVEAAAIARRRRPDVHFVVVGGGPLESELATLVERHSLSGGVTLLGERHDVDAILATADICVKPGVVEGFVGITVLEAQARGVPVIAFDTKDVRMAIEDGVTGLIVPAGNVEALADAVLGVLDDTEFARSLTEAGKAWVMAQFAMPVIVDDLLEIYAEVRGGL